MGRVRSILVAKQDGTLERFSVVKLSGCIATVLRAQGYDARLAVPLAKAVSMHLQEWRQAGPPSTAYVFQCARAVLEQTGLEEVATALCEHRRERRRRRAMLEVIVPEAPGGRPKPWRKRRVFEALAQEYGLRHAVARYLSGKIESQVFTLGYRTLTTTFLRELVRNEMMAWGLLEVGPARVSADGQPASVEPSPYPLPTREGDKTAPPKEEC